MLPKAIVSVFPPDVRVRGADYWAERRVRVTSADAGAIRAVVRGTYAYEVLVTATSGRLGMGCACPYAAEAGACKHLWAVLCGADLDGTLSPLLAIAGPDPAVEVLVESPEEFEEDRRHPPRGVAGHAARHAPGEGHDAGRARRGAAKTGRPSRATPGAKWKQVLSGVGRDMMQRVSVAPLAVWPDGTRIVYLIDEPRLYVDGEGVGLEVATVKQRKDGSWGAPKPMRASTDTWLATTDPDDRRIAQLLLGASDLAYYHHGATATYFIPPGAYGLTLRAICDSGRCYLRREPKEWPLTPVSWDAGGPWRLEALLAADPEGAEFALECRFVRDEATLRVAAVRLLHASGLFIADDRLAQYGDTALFPLAARLKQTPLTVSAAALPEFIGALHALPQPVSLEIPESVGVTREAPPCVPAVALRELPRPAVTRRGLTGDFAIVLTFDYGGYVVAGAGPPGPAFDPATRRIIARDAAAEAAARERLMALGAQVPYAFHGDVPPLVAPADKVLALVRECALAGWGVSLNGRRHRASTGLRMAVRSGVDWFDLAVTVSFGEREVQLPAVVAALRHHGHRIHLGYDDVGILTDDIQRQLAPFVALSTFTDGAARFTRAQASLLDTLLQLMPETTVDETFERARAEFRAFERIEPADPPAGFRGTLRPYQRDGLGWLHFARRFGLGGCLADDMGLGKTVQVLALLEARRAEGAGPSLAVVPRSLIFNWQQEAARFTPGLRVVDYTGTKRRGMLPTNPALGKRPAERPFGRRTALRGVDADLVLTTYGTLRQDVLELGAVDFDYVILDEAQAIKNASTASARAARLLHARHRLALSGTPIENRVEELWSIMEFLNPGMLGGAVGEFSADPALREALARALRPVILRRTKTQVAPDLPERVEQTLLVELEPPQRRVYDALLAQYRESLLARVDDVGIDRSKIQILEALLRLRQAACHPALLASRRGKSAAQTSAKLDAIVPMLAEAAAEGHKALVFSQFTSFLALLKPALDERELAYAYLDGDTRDRAAAVRRFETDPSCPLFLISLKAGGHGLNLTAAEYVFLLDPWWNPAVEAQAIDRAHRIGQTKRVIATRLVARDTIEEKILALQQTKRELADAILGGNQGVLAGIGREELELLLG